MMNETTDHLACSCQGTCGITRCNSSTTCSPCAIRSDGAGTRICAAQVDDRETRSHALVSIFNQDFSEVCEALDEGVRRGEVIEISDHEHAFSRISPWNDRLSYLDQEGNPKAEFVR